MTDYSFIHLWASLPPGLLSFLRAGLCLMTLFIFSTTMPCTSSSLSQENRQLSLFLGGSSSSILSIISNSGPMASPAQLSLSKLWEMVKDREAWRAVVHGVTKNWTRLSDWTEPNYSTACSVCPRPYRGSRGQLVRDLPGSESWRWARCGVWFWANEVTSLSLSFLLCKADIITVPAV